MRNFRTGVAIAALLIAAPARACTDWKAVAAFDAIVVEHARKAVVEEKDPEIAAVVKHNCDFVTSLVRRFLWILIWIGTTRVNRQLPLTLRSVRHGGQKRQKLHPPSGFRGQGKDKW
jgi:hypothetical protein